MSKEEREVGGMPLTEGEQHICGGSSRGNTQQREDYCMELSGNICQPEGHGPSKIPDQTCTTKGSPPPHSPQMAFPFLLGHRGSFIGTSQLQVILLQQCGTKEVNKQHRPSVLRRATHVPTHDVSSSPASPPTPTAAGEVERGGGKRGTAPHQARHTFQDTGSSPWPRRAGLKQSSSHSRLSDSPAAPPADGSNVLFMKGHCRWPGCKEVFQEYPSFLQHLRLEHRLSDHSASQWRIQRDVVQHLENQLTMEKQRLLAMQLHLHLPEHRSVCSLPEAQGEEPDREEGQRVRPSQAKDFTLPQGPHGKDSKLQPQGYWHIPTHHTLPGFIPSIECYKYNNIRPPYTYADLIRWAIQESPDKQLTLSEIYHWFTRMFFYFRHNTATWKNAIRHNLSLHKCFVRVEGAKGAVWTVNEAEFQKRKGQKLTRDQDLMWITPSSFWFPQGNEVPVQTRAPAAEQPSVRSQCADEQ
ncbi:hypothetical protein GJAV_G00175870 [Gymnothorax javanicus]|nr:hypothetical protein GJAV_G00175870 [Gymnothorax javanicus]